MVIYVLKFSDVHHWHPTFAACLQNRWNILDLCNCKLSSPLYPPCQILFFSLSIFLLCFDSGFSRKIQLWWALPEIAVAALLIHLNHPHRLCQKPKAESALMCKFGAWTSDLASFHPLSLIFGSLKLNSRVSQLTSQVGKQPWRRMYRYFLLFFQE